MLATSPSPPPQGRKVQLSFVENSALSGISAVVSKTAAAPLERIKMLLQSQDELLNEGLIKERFDGVRGVSRYIYRTEGVTGFWRSNTLNCLRYFPTQSLNFGFKAMIKENVPALAPNKADSYGLKLGKNIAGGGLAGFGSLCFVYSLDYARTRFAMDVKAAKKAAKGADGAAKAAASSAAEGGQKYKSILDVYRQTWKAEGFRGLYRGFTVSSVGIFVYRGLYFGGFDSLAPILLNMVPEGDEKTRAAGRFAVGYVVTVLAGLASYPIDTVRRRMMMDVGRAVPQYSGSIDCFGQVFREEGAKSFFKGAGANILRGVAGAGVLALFDTVREKYVAYAYGEGAHL